MEFYVKQNRSIAYEANKSLTDLANINETDKGDACKTNLSWGSNHPDLYTWSYTKTYDKYMSKLRSSHNPIKFLEIGICDHRFPFASVKMWLSYFENIDLYCVDNFWGGNSNQTDMIEQITKMGANFFFADQGSEYDWNNICDILGSNSIDFIVEDGSHQSSHMLYSLYRSIPLLKQNSYYFMEDIQDPKTTEGFFGYNNVDVYYSMEKFLKEGIFHNDILTPEQCSSIQNSFSPIEIHSGGPDHCKTLMMVLQKK